MQGNDESDDDVTRRSLVVRACQVRLYLTTSLVVTCSFFLQFAALQNQVVTLESVCITHYNTQPDYTSKSCASEPHNVHEGGMFHRLPYIVLLGRMARVPSSRILTTGWSPLNPSLW